MGYTMDGGYAEYAVAYASHVVAVPDAVTSLRRRAADLRRRDDVQGLKVARPQPGETAMVVGIGGLGHLGLQYARVFGITTVAVDVHDEKLQLAKELGADHVVDARGDQQAELEAIGGVDVALVTVPSPPRCAPPTPRSTPTAAWCSSASPPTTGSSSRSSRPCSRASGHRLARRHPQRPAECFDLHARA